MHVHPNEKRRWCCVRENTWRHARARSRAEDFLHGEPPREGGIERMHVRATTTTTRPGDARPDAAKLCVPLAGILRLAWLRPHYIN